MTEIDDIQRDFETAVAAAVAREAKVAWGRLVDAMVAPTATHGSIVTISVGEAAYLSSLSESQVRKLCEANPFGQSGGFGFKRGGRWEVVEESFLASRNLGPRVSRV